MSIGDVYKRVAGSYVLQTNIRGAKGDTGDNGIAWHGDWANAHDYVVNDAVYYNQRSFICILGHTSDTTHTRPLDGDTWGTYWNYLSGGVSSGEANTATSVGSGLDIVKAKSGVDFPIRSLNTDQFSENADLISLKQAILSGYARAINDGSIILDSATSISWRGSELGLFDGTDWQLVIPSSVPAAANTANALSGSALAVDKVYDVFMEYGSLTSCSLAFRGWGVSTNGTSTRYSTTWSSGVTAFVIGNCLQYGSPAHYYVCIQAHTAGATSEPGAGATWQDYWLDCGVAPYSTDFKGLYSQDGIWVLGPNAAGATSYDGRKYRWLGVLYTYNNSATVNFKDDENYRLIANFYNTISKLVVSANTTAGNWSYTGTAWRELNNGTNNQRAYWVQCVTQSLALHECIQAYHANPAVGADFGPYIDNVLGMWIHCGAAVMMTLGGSTNLISSSGYHLGYMQETSNSASYSMNVSGWSNCRFELVLKQ